MLVQQKFSDTCGRGKGIQLVYQQLNNGFQTSMHTASNDLSSPPRWRRGSGLDFGSEDPGSIPRLPSPRVGPLMARRLKTPSCLWRGCPAAGQHLETGHLSRHYIAEISMNVTLNHNQQQQSTTQPQRFNSKETE